MIYLYSLEILKFFSKLPVLLVIYVILGFYLLPYFQYQINTDGTALLSIAYAIKAGDFQGSINAHWGIISSLIIAPFLFLDKFQPIYLVKLSQLAIGFIGVIAFFLLSKKVDLNELVRSVVRVAIIPVILYFAFYTNTCDLLVVTFLMFYLSLILTDNFFKNVKYGLFCGVVGSLLSLTKEYFLYFFILHFSLFTLINLRNYRIKIIGRSYLFAIAIVAATSVLWGLVLMSKYHYFMLGSRGSVSLRIFNPRVPEYPMFTQGLIAPTNNFGISSWDEPILLNFSAWSPLESKESFIYSLNLVWKNFQTLTSVYFSFSILYIPILLLSIFYLYRKGIFKEKNAKLLYILMTFITFPIGYVALAVEARYVWINYILVFLIGVYFLSLAEKYFKNRSPFYLIFALFFVLLFIKTPVDFLRHNRYLDHTFFDQSKFLRERFDISYKKIATNTYWHQSLYLSVYNHDKFFGQTKPGSSYQQILAELKKNDIDYYFIWNDGKLLEEFQNNFKELKQSEIQNLHIIPLK